MPINEGTALGRYEIRAHLGTGGMGEVYLAQDTQLERTVALKILPPEFAADQQRMQRFVQEARAASALNHPNIITIHEIGEANSTHFIATEFIDGITLRQRMNSERLSLTEALDVAVQVAGALAAAHQAGVIHRDIKPENIMVRGDGYVKVLDFGLAKPTERASAIDSEAATRMLVNTSPGMIMGTVSYMSPEQTRGLALDGRTDIWSLGVTLYEMLTGRVPFSGQTTSDVIVSVLDREPAPLADFLPDAPAELQRIVRKSLRKDKEERYQSIKDMMVDLRALKQELEFEAKLGRATGSSGGIHSTHGSGEIHGTSGRSVRAAFQTDREEMAAETDALLAARNTAGALEAHAREKRGKRGMLLLLSLCGVLLFAGLAFAAYKIFWSGAHRTRSTPFQTTRISRLTSTGKSIDASISPDGNYVAHVFSDGSQRSLWIRQVASSRNVQLVPPAEVNYYGATFTPDSSHVYYVRGDRNQPVKDLYQISVLGGEPKKVLADVDSAVKFSPDGKRLTFMRLTPGPDRQTDLMIANADGTGEQILASRKAPDGWWHPVWSPDGTAIACIAVNAANDYRVQLIEVQIEDKSERALSPQTWREAACPVWLQDGSGVLLLAPADEALESSQIWFVDKASGQARRITNDLNTYVTLSVTADAGTLATVQSNRISNIWVAPGADAIERAQQITNESSWGYGIAWTPDGRIVYSSNASGKQDIWIVNADGTNQRQLTDNTGLNLQPVVSPDGRTIVFVSDHADSGTHLWKMDINGGNLKQLTNGKHEHYPQFSPDGRWVVFTSATAGKPTIWKVSIDGGEPVQLTEKYSKLPVVSPDGKLVACHYWEEVANIPFSIALIPFDGGAPVKTINNLPAIVRWAGDGRALTYVETRGAVSNLWSQSLDGGQPKKLTEWKSERIFDFAWSGDGKRLALARGVTTNDVILISDFKQGGK